MFSQEIIDIELKKQRKWHKHDRYQKAFWFNCRYEVGVSKLDLIISRACHNDIQYHPRLCGKGNLSPPSGKLQQHCSGDPECLLLLFQKNICMYSVSFDCCYFFEEKTSQLNKKFCPFAMGVHSVCAGAVCLTCPSTSENLKLVHPSRKLCIL